MRGAPPVLCYHRIGGPLELGVTRVGRSVFARQMTALARAGWRTLTLDEFAYRRTAYGAPRTFLLTFDDGYASLAGSAYPILADLGFSATTFLITDYVGKTNTWDVQYTWNRLQHLGCTWLDEASIEAELRRSRETLTARLGPQAGRAVAYPFGAVNPLVLGIAQRVGYALGFGGVRGGGNPLQLRRVPVYFWDAGDVPFGLRTDALGSLGRFVAHAANRCAVGTPVIKGVWSLVSGVRPETRHLTPDT